MIVPYSGFEERKRRIAKQSVRLNLKDRKEKITMGCGFSNYRIDALDARLTKLETIAACENPLLRAFEMTNVSTIPALTDDSQEKIKQALTEVYGGASKELVRLETVLETLKASNNLVSIAKQTMDDAKAVSAILPFVQDEEIVADRPAIAYLFTNFIDFIHIKPKDSDLWIQIDNSNKYPKTTGCTVVPVLPGDSIIWTRSRDSSRSDSFGYYVVL